MTCCNFLKLLLVRIKYAFFAISIVGCPILAEAQQPSIAIIAPAPGSIITSGDIISVTVVASTPSLFSAIQVVGEDIGDSLPIVTPPFVFSLTVPKNIVGQKKLKAYGLLKSGGDVTSPPVVIDIEPSVPIIALLSSPESVGFQFVGEQRLITISGRLNDDSPLYLGKSSQLTMDSGDPNVAVVNTNGIITATGTGKTDILATYGTASVLIPVSVPTTVRGDLNGDGIVDDADLSIIQSALNKPATKPLDARDLNGDGKIDAVDAQMLITLCIQNGGGNACQVTLPSQPVANAGTNQNVTAGTTVTLNGSGSSDPDGQPLTFFWTQTVGPPVNLNNAHSATPTFTAPAVSTDTILTFQLIVNNGTTGSVPATVDVTVRPATDTTPPVLNLPANITAEATSPAGAVVTYAVSANDQVDGAVTPVCTPAPGSIFALGTTNVSCSATDKTGNTASGSFSITVRDTTPPTIVGSASPAANTNGWRNSAVTVSFTCADTVSGIAACTAPQSLGEGANQSFNGTASDNAGNTASATVAGINVDLTAPAVSVTGVANGATYILSSVPAAGCMTTDALSGVQTNATLGVTGGNADGTGTFTATCTGATDRAGNPGAASVIYQVNGVPPGTGSTFSAFSVGQLRINQRLKTIFLLSNFTLGQTSNGIDPVKDTVTLTIANFTTTIPAGSFRRGPAGVYVFAGKINKVSIEMLITPLGKNRFLFQAAAYDATLSGIRNPVTMELTIGNDHGTTSVNAIIN